MLSVVILIAVLVQFVVCPALFYASARLLRTKAGVKRALLTWLVLSAVDVSALLISALLQIAVIALLVSGMALILTLWLPGRLLRVGFWHGLGVLAASTILSVAVALGVRAVAVEAFLMPLASMAPTILPGDRILADKLTSRILPPRRGDVVVYAQLVESARDWARPPEERRLEQETWVKRIVGLPGDLVEVREDRVVVNGRDVGSNLAGRHGDPDGKPFQGRIPQGMMYLVGDNKEWSRDSRMLGPVPISSIKGKAVIIYASTVVDQPMLRRGPSAGNPPEWHNPHDRPGRVRWERIGKVVR